MDRAVIIGTFEFIGFHFCKALLDEGFEIEGIHIDGANKDPFLLEKRLEIGRNANFLEKEYSDWIDSPKEIDKETLILIDYYDLYMQDNGMFTKEKDFVGNFLVKNLKNLRNSDSRIVFLLPIQYLNGSKIQGYCENVIEILQGGNISFQAFYLPSIYGPWQSSAFIFQQYLLKEINNLFKLSFNGREWVDDALFIEDVVGTILEETEQKSAGTWLLKSSIEDHWKKCAEYLSIPYENYIDFNSKGSINIGRINVKTVESTVKFSEGLVKQKRHLDLLLDGGII